MVPSRLLLLRDLAVPVWKVSVSSGVGNRGQRLQEKTTTLGLRYDYSDTLDFKVQASTIKVEGGANTTGAFLSAPADDTVKLYGVAVDVLF